MQDTITFSDNFVESDVTVDAAQLAEITRDCFLLSMETSLDDGVQGILYSLGIRLREQHRHLIKAVFDRGTDALTQANDEIKRINKKLKQVKADLDRVADVIGGLGALTKQLDELLKIAKIVF